MIKFKPDLFSLSGPNWHKINKNDAKLFKFSGLPEDKKKEIKNILKIRGLEINSSNLLLEFRDSKIVAKKLHSLSPYKYKDLVKTYEFLKEKNSPTPEISNLHYKDDFLIKSFSRREIYLNFTEGRYFNGSYTDLIKTAKSINLLNKITGKISYSKIEKISILPKRSSEILEKFFYSLSKDTIKLNIKNINILKKNETLIFKIYDELKKNLKLIQKRPEGIFHIDLHPHNILINKSHSIIMDIESLKKTKYEIATGFGIFKLLRQTLTKTRSEKNFIHYSKKFIEEIHGKDFSKIDVKILFQGAKFEIFRRLLIIMKGNLEGNVSPWNKVLEIQVNALSEVKELEKIVTN